MKTMIGLIPSGVLDAPDDPLADSLGTAPERLGNGCGCDRPRWSVRPCGHCACTRRVQRLPGEQAVAGRARILVRLRQTRAGRRPCLRALPVWLWMLRDGQERVACTHADRALCLTTENRGHGPCPRVAKWTGGPLPSRSAPHSMKGAESWS